MKRGLKENGRMEHEVILKKITAIASVNDEIIQRVKSKTTVIGYQYFVEPKATEKILQLDLSEDKTKLSSSNILSSWSCKSNMTQIDDLFNDKLNYSCQNLDDCICLNKHMLLVAKKYAMFNSTPQSIEELKKFMCNYEILQTFLGDLDEKLCDAQSQMDFMKEQVDMINNLLQQLGSHKAVFFGRKPLNAKKALLPKLRLLQNPTIIIKTMFPQICLMQVIAYGQVPNIQRLDWVLFH